MKVKSRFVKSHKGDYVNGNSNVVGWLVFETCYDGLAVVSGYTRFFTTRDEAVCFASRRISRLNNRWAVRLFAVEKIPSTCEVYLSSR